MKSHRVIILFTAVLEALTESTSNHRAASERTIQRRMAAAGVKATPKEISTVCWSLTNLGAAGYTSSTSRGVPGYWKLHSDGPSSGLARRAA
jgi:hypothetical protein